MADPTNRAHPDALSIDLLRSGEGTAEDGAHVARCPECQRVLADLTAIAAELRGAAIVPPAIPEEIDQRILWNARKRAAQIRRADRRGYRTILRPAWAAAAAVLLALAGVEVCRRDMVLPRSLTTAQLAKGDIDADGRVDIVDALQLARAVEARGAVDPAWDVNADGVVDERDAEAVAMRAVAIKGT